MNLTRRALLAGLIPTSVALVACADDPNLVRIPATAGGPTREGEPPALVLPRAPVAQGGTFLAALTGSDITSATVEFGGRRTAAVNEGAYWLAIVGCGQLVGSVEQVRPGTHTVRMRYERRGVTGVQLLDGAVTVSATEFPVEAIMLEPGVASLLDPALIEQENAVLKEMYGAVTPVRLWDGFFQRPSPAAITDVYGSRRSFNGGPASGSHSGVDFGAAAGAPALAAATGRVALAKPLPVRGNTVILDHGAGVFTGYCHLSAFALEPGQDVRVGDRIGSVGATGLASGAHLHWEVVAGGMHLDGLRWLAP
jgi:hypothetical protein